jgi:hypothetical protein
VDLVPSLFFKDFVALAATRRFFWALDANLAGRFSYALTIIYNRSCGAFFGAVFFGPFNDEPL